MNAVHKVLIDVRVESRLWVRRLGKSTTAWQELQDRRSFFALFARRVFFSFRKLSFIGLSSLADDLRAWAAGDKERGYQKVVRDAIRDGAYFLKLFSIPAEISLDNLLVRPQFDRETFAEADSFGEYVRCSSYMGVVFLTGGSSFEKARATGDLHSAEENLRRFFEQRFNDGSDSWVVFTIYSTSI